MKQVDGLNDRARFTPTPAGSGPTPQESAWKRLVQFCRSSTRLFILIALLISVSCNRAPSAKAPERTLVVFSTVYPLADIAREVGGEHVKVDWLLDLGDPIAGYTLTDKDRVHLAGVDLVLCDGLTRTETWAQHELDRLSNTNTVISVDHTPGADQAPGVGLLYLDPQIASKYALDVGQALARRQPSNGQTFLARAAGYAKKIDAVAGSAGVRADSQLVVTTELFTPLLSRLGVKQVFVDVDPLHLRPRDAETLRRSAADAGARAMLVPFDTPPGTLTYLEQQTGLKVFTIDPMGYPNFDQHSTYLDVLKFNLEQIHLASAW